MSTKGFHMRKLKSYTLLDDGQTAKKMKLEIISDIKRKMNDKNISASKLARLTGINKSYISKILNCKVNLTIKMLAKMYQGLDCTIEIRLVPINDYEKCIELNVIKDDDFLMMCG